jgi:hypothetical protein
MIAASAGVLIAAAAALAMFGIGFVLGIAYGVRETMADQAERQMARIRAERTYLDPRGGVRQ